MNRDRAINILSALLMLLGLLEFVLSLVFASAWGDVLTAAVDGLLLLVAGWLLYKRQKFALVVMVISAALYFASGWYSAHTHGMSLSMLIPAFFWSLALRVLFVLFALFLMKRPVAGS